MSNGSGKGIFARKSVADFESDLTHGGGLKRTLGKWHLTALGVGATIGAGIFATTGTAIVGDPLRPGAGPAIIFSFFLTAIACGFGTVLSHPGIAAGGCAALERRVVDGDSAATDVGAATLSGAAKASVLLITRAIAASAAIRGAVVDSRPADV